MQAGRDVAGCAKEAAMDVAASARAGLDKTKAVVQEKVEKITAKFPAEREMATRKKEERIREAELNKQEARAQSAAERDRTRVSAGSGVAGHPGGVAGVPGQHHGTSATAVSQSIGLSPGTGTGTGTGTAAAHGPLTGGTTQTGY